MSEPYVKEIEFRYYLEHDKWEIGCKRCDQRTTTLGRGYPDDETIEYNVERVCICHE